MDELDELEPVEGEDDAEDAQAKAIDAFLMQCAQEFERDKTADQDNRRLAYEDLEFVAGKQWSVEDEEARRKAKRPCITQDHLSQIIKQVTNDIRLNKPGINLKPSETDDRSQADVTEGLVRHIEYKSGAARVYANWAEASIECGVGHARINIEEDEDGRNCLRQREIEDPLSVIWDASAVRRDRSDARRCWVIDYLPRDLVDQEFPDSIGEWPDENEVWQDWYDDYDEVRICEVWKVMNVTVKTWIDADGRGHETRGDMEGPEGAVLTGESRRREVRSWLVTPGKILDGGLEGTLWPGSRIPVFPCLGEEKRLGRKVVRNGMVRKAKDAQRLINWGLSLVVEAMAAAPKAKWVGPSKAFQGFEEEWETAHTSPKAYIPFNDLSAAPPQFSQPPVFPQGLVEAVGLFTEGMKRVTGIYDASLGAKSNETSGKAIVARERQGDVGTFHYIDNFIGALTTMAQALVELIPLVYSDERKVRILGRDMQEKVVSINQVDEVTGARINMLSPAAYDVIVESGPAFSTRRQEAAEGMMTLIQALPEAAPLIADLLAQTQDWPDADKLAMRLKAMVPPQVLQMEQNGGQMPPQQPDPMAQMAKQAEVMGLVEETRGKKLSNDEKEIQIRAMVQGFVPAGQPAAGNGAAPNGASPAGFRGN